MRIKKLNRKEKVRKIHDLVSGKNPNEESETHVWHLDTYSSEALNMLLRVNELPQEQIERIFEGKRFETEEAFKQFLHSDELRELMGLKPNDKVIIMVPTPGCDPIRDYSNDQEATQEIKAEAPQDEQQSSNINTYPKEQASKIQEECVLEGVEQETKRSAEKN